MPFVAVAAWGAIERPGRLPTWTEELGRSVVREGAATRWVADVDAPGADLVAAELAAAERIDRRPDAGAVIADDSAAERRIEIGVRPTRWGRRTVGEFRVTAIGVWGAFRSVGDDSQVELTALPLPVPFDSAVPFRPADGLVGQYRAGRAGEGGEFAKIRPFQAGDRLRRVNWPRSTRADELQVNATWADEDSHVVLVLDVSMEIGVDLDDERDSSLDIGVRATGAISEHLTRRGDRVALHVYGGATPRIVPPGTGRAHERRMLEVLATVRAGDGSRSFRNLPPLLPGLADASLVVMLSPLAATDALDRAAALGRRGLSVVVIDTLPSHLTEDDDPITSLAWRIRMLERRREIRRIERVGVPVVRWRGPLSLDEFLRDVARRARAPRMRSS